MNLVTAGVPKRKITFTYTIDQDNPMEVECHNRSDLISRILSADFRKTADLSYIINEVLENLYKYHLCRKSKPKVKLIVQGELVKIISSNVTSKRNLDRLSKAILSKEVPVSGKTSGSLGIYQLVNYYSAKMKLKYRKLKSSNYLLVLSIVLPAHLFR